MFTDLVKYDWVHAPLVYDSVAQLLQEFEPAVVTSALKMEDKLLRRKFEALSTPRIEDFIT